MTDAKSKSREEKDRNKLTNIGPKSAAWLRQVGIRTIEDVRENGAMGAYLKVKRAGFKPGLNVLYALVGAIESRPMNSLSAEEKAALVEEVTAYDDAQKQSKKQIFEVRDVTAERTAEGPQHQRLRTARGDELRSGPDARDPQPDAGATDARDPLAGPAAGSGSPE